MIDLEKAYPDSDWGEVHIDATHTFVHMPDGGERRYYSSRVNIVAAPQPSREIPPMIPESLVAHLDKFLHDDHRPYMISSGPVVINFLVGQRYHVEPLIEDIKREIMMEKLSRE